MDSLMHSPTENEALTQTETKWRQFVADRLRDGDERMSRIEESIAVNTAATIEVKKSTEGVVTAFAAAEGAFKVLETLGKIAKPLAFLAL